MFSQPAFRIAPACIDKESDGCYIMFMIPGVQNIFDEFGPGGFPLSFFQQHDAGVVEEADISEKKEDEAENKRRKLYCKACMNLITLASYRIEVNGAHSHTFMNPRGIVFHIGCFMNAQGCLITGSPTSEFTWFSGYRWCHVLCANCLNHLGWYYQSGGASFFGLILDQLVHE